MTPRTPSFRRRHVHRCDKIIHVAQPKPFSSLLEPCNPPPIPNPNADLMVEGFSTPEDKYSAPMPDMTPEWIIVTQLPAQSQSGTLIKQEPLSSGPNFVVWENATATAVPAGVRGRKRVQEDVDGEDEHEFDGGDRDGMRRRKKVKMGHPGSVSAAKAAPAAPTINQSTQIGGDCGINARNASNGASTPLLSSAPPPLAPTTSIPKERSNGHTTPEPPSWCPITSPPPPPPLPPAMPTYAQSQYNRQVALQQMLIKQFDTEDTLLILNEWYRSGWMGTIFQDQEWRLPGLRELGLDVLYEPGQMDWWRWRETCFGAEEEEERDSEESNTEDGVGVKPAATDRMVPGPRDFWSVVV